jgi:cytochrome c peroxidase
MWNRLRSGQYGLKFIPRGDGRETIARLDQEKSFQMNLTTNLKHQAMDAVLTHSQADNPPTDKQLDEIVNFELGLFTAQVDDDRAGPLFLEGGEGGPLLLQAQPYYPGTNDSLGHDPHGGEFNPKVFNLYTRWLDKDSLKTDKESAREEIAAGEELFHSAALKITGVRGLNDNPALGDPKQIAGTCSTCHDTPGVGNHSLPLPLDIATSHAPEHEPNQTIAESLVQLSLSDLPIYLVDCPAPDKPGHRVKFYTSDPGKSFVTGKCGDVNRIKGPILRGLAGRAPYFHNGAAANLE